VAFIQVNPSPFFLFAFLARYHLDMISGKIEAAKMALTMFAAMEVDRVSLKTGALLRGM
jgi:hypothetical protein